MIQREGDDTAVLYGPAGLLSDPNSMKHDSFYKSIFMILQNYMNGIEHLWLESPLLTL